MKTRMFIAAFLVSAIAVTAGCRYGVQTISSPEASIAADVAAAYGSTDFSKIDTIRFTFNIKIGDRHIQRKWTWRPEIDSIFYEGKLPSGFYANYAYLRQYLDQHESGISEKVDRWFINDQYWLMFPLHLDWDRELKITFDEGQPLPIPPGNARRLTVTYPEGIGYTPGDSYELYLDDSNLIQQWVYRKGGAEKPTGIATWENHVKTGPLVLSLEHKLENNKIRLWFSDVAVRLKGNEKWITPEPLK